MHLPFLQSRSSMAAQSETPPPQPPASHARRRERAVKTIEGFHVPPALRARRGARGVGSRDVSDAPSLVHFLPTATCVV